LERSSFSTAANDRHVSRIGARALFLHPHRLLARLALVHDPSPADVLEMAVLARANETDWRHFRFVACRRLIRAGRRAGRGPASGPSSERLSSVSAGKVIVSPFMVPMWHRRNEPLSSRRASVPTRHAGVAEVLFQRAPALVRKAFTRPRVDPLPRPLRLRA
jgi:hypothetical protein